MYCFLQPTEKSHLLCIQKMVRTEQSVLFVADCCILPRFIWRTALQYLWNIITKERINTLYVSRVTRKGVLQRVAEVEALRGWWWWQREAVKS